MTTNEAGHDRDPFLEEPPVPPPGDWDPPEPLPQLLRRRGAVMLDPPEAVNAADGPRPRATAYVRDRLLAPASQVGAVVDRLTRMGVRATPDQRVQGLAGRLAEVAARLEIPLDLPVALTLRPQDPLAPPVDAWTALQFLRQPPGEQADAAQAPAAPGVGLDHLVTGNPPAGYGLSTGVAGAGGTVNRTGYDFDGEVRLPVANRLPEPAVGPIDREGRCPVVAVVDTGCAEHPWFPTGDPDRVDRTAEWKPPIGLSDPNTDPERMPNQFGPLDGVLDWAAGHGTFICGVVRQACPEARLLVTRILQSDGSADESAIVTVLGELFEKASQYLLGEPGGVPIDVLTLSLGYYPEHPDTDWFLSPMREIIDAFGAIGTAVVAAAGNDAVSRPMLPAYFAPHDGFEGRPGVVPVVSVGALNPNRSVAAFSNSGSWVTTWAPGALMVSTFPRVQGSLQPPLRTPDPSSRVREDVDGDDFHSGFALWSGTSFAAPWVAGEIAAALRDAGDGCGASLGTRSKADAVRRATEAVHTVVAGRG